MFDDKERQMMYNHVLGKMKLYSRSKPSSVFKIHLHKSGPGDPGRLEVHSRQYGQSWRRVDWSRENKMLWESMERFLVGFRNHDYWYIQPEEFDRLKKRFDVAEQKAAERAAAKLPI
ncbi:hypothetical protein [Stenotrophomonas sp. GD03657]|uniref:hypothetical protein n=1 Tax=Stenotrophomonas sp. GD03657 TaxID=2975363 RepID=UPI00244AF1EB|nr:hypothetical protein [Stenotrophomonas sp. GD03657]MDH2154172.1 hypothetical protein [Stenotrophomonas sp. GD03657]